VVFRRVMLAVPLRVLVADKHVVRPGSNVLVSGFCNVLVLHRQNPRARRWVGARVRKAGTDSAPAGHVVGRKIDGGAVFGRATTDSSPGHSRGWSRGRGCCRQPPPATAGVG
jgi:hypothetical protein